MVMLTITWHETPAVASDRAAIKSLVPSAGNMHELMYPPDMVFKGGEGVKRIVNARESDHQFFHQSFRNKYWYVKLSGFSSWPSGHGVAVTPWPGAVLYVFSFAHEFNDSDVIWKLFPPAWLTERTRLIDCRTTTLFAWTGRALPIPQMLIYIAYVLVVTLCIHFRWPGYANNAELRAIAAPLTTMGEAQQQPCTPAAMVATQSDALGPACASCLCLFMACSAQPVFESTCQWHTRSL